MKNARFWIWWNDSWVKITLMPGGSVSLQTGGLTDEGFSCEAQVYNYEDAVVSCEITTWERDCDGRHEWRSESHCNQADLKANGPDEHGPARPAWERGISSQYDEYAELAGY